MPDMTLRTAYQLAILLTGSLLAGCATNETKPANSLSFQEKCNFLSSEFTRHYRTINTIGDQCAIKPIDSAECDKFHDAVAKEVESNLLQAYMGCVHSGLITMSPEQARMIIKSEKNSITARDRLRQNVSRLERVRGEYLKIQSYQGQHLK